MSDPMGVYNPKRWWDEHYTPPVMKMGEAQQTSFGAPDHLSKADAASIKQHFDAIITILMKSGMDKARIVEFFHGLVDNWWIDTCIKVSTSLVGLIS